MDTLQQIDPIKKLLKKVQLLKSREIEITALRDENFNIFKILRQSISEEVIHSRFIFELLNPSGSHQKGNTFLKLFLKILKSKYQLKEEVWGLFENLKVTEAKNEKYFGPVDNAWEEGGFLDIYIESPGFIIGIENKIYAGLGTNQLERYKNYLNTFNKNCFLLYLTLYGDIGKGKDLEVDKDYYAISYTKFIIPWLELCHQHASDNPSIRETIKQYINIIKELTGQLTNHTMNKELENLLLENYDSALTIAKAFENVKNLKARKVYEELEKKINGSLGLEYAKIKIGQEILDADWLGFRITNKNWVNGLMVYFEGYKKLIDGFTHGLMFENYPEYKFKNKMDGKIRIKKLKNVGKNGNLWINHENGRYSNLNIALEKNDDINELAEELKDYVLSIVYKLEPDAKQITEVFVSADR